jgi:MinD superfamily P-loop ATPase
VLDALEIEGTLLINKYQSSFSLLSEREIGKLFGMECAGRIPYIEYGWQAEIEKKTLMGAGRFRKAVEEITSVITGETWEERSWIKNLISRNT